jgi:hypothetical protein
VIPKLLEGAQLACWSHCNMWGAALGVQALFKLFGEAEGAQGVKGKAEAEEGAHGKEGGVAGEEGEGRVEFVAGCGGCRRRGRGSGGVCFRTKDGYGSSDPEGVCVVRGIEEPMDQPPTPDGMPSCDVLPPGEEAEAPFFGVASEELSQGWVGVGGGVARVVQGLLGRITLAYQLEGGALQAVEQGVGGVAEL